MNFLCSLPSHQRRRGLHRPPIIDSLVSLIFVSAAFFYLGKYWSDGNQQLVFFTRQVPAVGTPAEVVLSPNLDKKFNISALINETQTQTETKSVDYGKAVEKSALSPSPSPVLPSASLLPPRPYQINGIVDENGTMSDEFEVGKFDPEFVENWGNDTQIHEEKSEKSKYKFKNMKFGPCNQSMREYIPCMDNVEAIKRLKSTERGERFERHCPEVGKGY
ncbi:hypothetical protein SLEP1_g33132 [Rubroshorea leprosula]|uniref:Methyltransferase n=1 Tax=Rubroshorea leprosula TaxID=152421 RepID=A0AAV5KFP3_9ROSI|nr:hypothetical protein SLEP1_g33132 [Rubroshorea leprosula]